jgi:hypothetical protein
MKRIEIILLLAGLYRDFYFLVIISCHHISAGLIILAPRAVECTQYTKTGCKCHGVMKLVTCHTQNKEKVRRPVHARH